MALTSAIPLLPDPDVNDAPGETADIGVLKAGLDALAGSDVDEARKFRDSLPAEALDRHILTWAIAMSGDPRFRAARSPRRRKSCRNGREQRR